VKRAFLSFFLSIALIEMLAFLVFLTGCKGANYPIQPVIPNGNHFFDSSSPSPEGNTNHRTNYESHTCVRLIVTGPSEYLSSKLTPPVFTETSPIFSAKVENNITALSSENFIAMVDGKIISTVFDPAANEIRFSPEKPFENGKYTADLIFKNPDGSPRNYHWSFFVDTAPPKITAVMWSDDKSAMVIFDQSVEPDIISDPARWSFNNESDILTAPIEKAGSNIVILPLSKDAFDIYKLKQPLTVSFNHKNGRSDYVVSRGGSGRKAQYDYPCGCQYITATIEQEHHILEAGAEKYAFAYQVINPSLCYMIMKIEGWSRIPVGHDYAEPPDPPLNACNYYDQDEDTQDYGGPIITDPRTYSLEFNGNPLIIDTLPFDREFKHCFTVSFWADCNQNLGPDGSIFETCINSILINFNESFDSTLPVFDVEPVVLYGDEAAQKLLDMTSDISFISENPPEFDKYCSMTPELFHTAWVDYLLDRPCDLFILTQAHDFNDAGMHGNILNAVLDIKHESGVCEYGKPISEAGMGLFYDYYPLWGSSIPGAEGFELITDWFDPDYGECPDGIFHDWDGEEGQIAIFDLTEILSQLDNQDVTGIRVRITDNTGIDGITHAKGNWRRSDNVMEQLNSGPFPVKARFINDNPYDDTNAWKIVKYAGNTNDMKTSFIYNRSIDGLNDGRVNLDFFILLDVLNPDPRSIKDFIDVNFTSTETRFPQGFDRDVILRANLIHDGDNILNLIPGGFSRLEELLVPTNKCPYYYHVCLTVTDSDATSEQYNRLYVSSNDHLLSNSAKMDNTQSFQQNWPSEYGTILPDPQNPSINFGVRRGTGYSSCNINEKYWYGYDELIANGGFEIIKPQIVDSEYLVPEEDYVYFNVPVQSESDLMVLWAHGYHFPLNTGLDLFRSVLGDFANPQYSCLSNYDKIQNRHLFISYYDNSINCFNWDFTYCSDFDAWLYGWGGQYGFHNYWLKNAGELRWLVLLACSQLSHLPEEPILQWKNIIADNYCSSVCGYSTPPHYCPEFYKKYSTKLNVIFYANNFIYEPSYHVFLNNDLWYNDYSKTCDLSVAAWMEAACELINRGDALGNDYHNYYFLQSAEAIDRDNIDNQYYYWRLDAIPEHSSNDKRVIKYKYKIRKYSL